MRLLYKPIILIVAGWLCLAAASPAQSVTVPERPVRYVVDQAGIIDDRTETKLNGLLQELEQKTTAQFVILTIESLDGEAIEDVALTVAHDKWKLGQKGKDNGLLLLVSVKDHKYRIEVGYGLEGVLPDSYVGSVGRDFLVPYFQKGDYSQGIFAAALALTKEIARQAGVSISGMPKRGQPGGQDAPGSFFKTVFSLLVFIIVMIVFLRNPKAFLLFFLFSSMSGSSRRWGGGGGFGDGFGSFGGGGGGGFGGGGASGGW